MKTKPTEQEIQSVLEDAIVAECECMEDGSEYPGMTYEQGVAAAMRWVTGETKDHPLED